MYQYRQIIISKLSFYRENACRDLIVAAAKIGVAARVYSKQEARI